MSVLEIHNLVKKFGRTEVVCSASLTVEQGMVYGLLGPNGAGKTTLLSCALGLMRPSKGEAFVLGEPARRIARLRGRVGVVFDKAVLVPGLSARANLEYARRFAGVDTGRQPDEVLDLVGLHGQARNRAGTLSLGQTRRLSIAMALLGAPELLVLDEPLSGLDPLGVRAMLALFRTLAGEGITFVLSSHRLHEMESVVTHAGILLAGRLEREGTLDELLGGSGDSFVVHCAPLARAREVAEGLDGVTVQEEVGDFRLRVRLPGTTSAALNRALVDGGCEVSRLEPVRATLQDVFERLADVRGATEGSA